MDKSVVIDSNPASCLPINPSLGSPTRGAATARIAGVPRALVAASILLLVAFSGHVGHARDRLSGEVERVKMIGFTVADVDREANFFAKVLQFEKISDFRVVGSEYDKMEGVFNANMRIVHLKLGEQIVELTQYVSPRLRPLPGPFGRSRTHNIHSDSNRLERETVLRDAAQAISDGRRAFALAALAPHLPETLLPKLGMEFAQEGGKGPARGAAPRGAGRRKHALHPTGRVEETWWIMQAPPPVHSYVPGSWGPLKAADPLVAGHGRWHGPWVTA